MSEDAPELLTFDELAKKLRLKKSALYTLVARRAIPVIRINSRLKRFRWSDVEAALAKLTVKAI